MQIAIIGGGAAGMMAAASILERGRDAEIHIFDKNNKLGTKVLISGGSRCNVTTGIEDIKLLKSKYVRGYSFLLPALKAFPPAAVNAWFESNGVPLKVEKDLRVFPVSDDGKDVVGVFEKMFAKANVKIHLLEPVKTIVANGEKFKLNSTKAEYDFDKVIVTTGGNAYRHTGSSGDGYDFATSLGHTITQLGPSLNSFATAEIWCRELAGLSFQKAKLVAVLASGEKVEAQGPLLFTHMGISGPAAFVISAHLAFNKFDKTVPQKISLLPEAEMTFDDWESAVLKLIAENNTKQIHNALDTALPARFVEVILQIAGVDPEIKCTDLTKIDRRKIVHLLSGDLQLNLTARLQGEEFVTAGGVELSEINSKTMQSKINPNLYFAGEVLNIDGVTGGFNLQAAWSTGRMAGKNL